jgi:hypothetical protein
MECSRIAQKTFREIALILKERVQGRFTNEPLYILTI